MFVLDTMFWTLWDTLSSRGFWGIKNNLQTSQSSLSIFLFGANSVADTIPHCTILYYTILYYTILYYTILQYNILYYTILNYTILYYITLYYTIIYHTILYYTILRKRHNKNENNIKLPNIIIYLCFILRATLLDWYYFPRKASFYRKFIVDNMRNTA